MERKVKRNQSYIYHNIFGSYVMEMERKKKTETKNENEKKLFEMVEDYIEQA